VVAVEVEAGEAEQAGEVDLELRSDSTARMTSRSASSCRDMKVGNGSRLAH
jgi:hypothetical protein